MSVPQGKPAGRPTQFRESLLLELHRRRWTAYRLHRESGISKSVIYEYLRGKREITTDSLEAICSVLGLRLTSSTPNSS